MSGLYNYRWQQARLHFLRRNPLCRFCRERFRRIRVATVVDHIRPHKGDPTLFWDQSNWQQLCKECHDSVKQSEERGGRPRVAIGLDGFPLEASGGEAVRPAKVKS